MSLIEELIQDEKKIDKSLYSSGPYWEYKNLHSIIEIKKKGISDFRGLNSGAGISFTDTMQIDARNDLGIKGRFIANFFSIPFVKKIYEHQLKLTQSHIEDNLKMLSIIYNNSDNVKKILEKYKFENTTDFGCAKKFTYKDKKEYSTFYIEIANRIENLSLKFNFSKINSFFEIGGGFGANVHFLLTNFSNIKKIIYLDVVPNIFIGTEYLRNFYKESVKDYSETKRLNKIKFEDNNKLEIICIPPWEIEKLDVKLDHFHNAASFVEMPQKVVKNYCQFIKKFRTKEISLVSYDKFDENTTFSPEILNNFFDNELEVMWHNRAIKDLKRKDIYLYSN